MDRRYHDLQIYLRNFPTPLFAKVAPYTTAGFRSSGAALVEEQVAYEEGDEERKRRRGVEETDDYDGRIDISHTIVKFLRPG
eukprot:757747-Hanusia_phi.AAC.5